MKCCKHQNRKTRKTMNSIPQGWEIKTLGEVCEINPKNKLDDDLEVSFIPMNLIADKYQNKFSYETRKWSKVKKGYTHLQNYCIAIAKITPCFENGKCVILQDLKNGYGAGTTELIVVLADKNKILPKFIFYFFNTTNFTKEGVKNFKGTAGQLRISKDFIANLQIPLPPLSTQKLIVEKLENAFAHIDEAVRHLKSIQTNIPRLKSSLLHCAFSGKLTESQNSSHKVQTLKSVVGVEGEFERKEGETLPFEPPHPLIKAEIPQGWEIKTLGEVCEITMGQSPKGEQVFSYNKISSCHSDLECNEREEFQKDSTLKDISATHQCGNSKNGNDFMEFHQGKICFTDKYLSESEFVTTDIKKFAEKDSILLCVRAPVGIINITKRKVAIGRGLCALKMKNQNNDFLYFYLLTLENYFNQKATGSTFSAITMNVVKNTLIPIQ